MADSRNYGVFEHYRLLPRVVEMLYVRSVNVCNFESNALCSAERQGGNRSDIV